MALKKLTIAEFKEAYNRIGASVMELADIAAQCVTDDDELVMLAKAAVNAEDAFLAALNNRDIEL